MDKASFIDFIANLNLAKHNYVVFGGGIMTLRGIRRCGDLDLFITEHVYRKLLKAGWSEKSEKNRSPYLVTIIDGFAAQAFGIWEGDGWQPSLKEYIDNPEMIEHVPCMPLKELYEWKKVTRRPKDIEDLKLIEEYWAQNKN